jgi:hypothetical protein
VVDDFDGDAAGFGFVEGAGGVAVECGPGFGVGLAEDDEEVAFAKKTYLLSCILRLLSFRNSTEGYYSITFKSSRKLKTLGNADRDLSAFILR